MRRLKVELARHNETKSTARLRLEHNIVTKRKESCRGTARAFQSHLNCELRNPPPHHTTTSQPASQQIPQLHVIMATTEEDVPFVVENGARVLVYGKHAGVRLCVRMRRTDQLALLNNRVEHKDRLIHAYLDRYR